MDDELRKWLERIERLERDLLNGLSRVNRDVNQVRTRLGLLESSSKMIERHEIRLQELDDQLNCTLPHTPGLEMRFDRITQRDKLMLGAFTVIGAVIGILTQFFGLWLKG